MRKKSHVIRAHVPACKANISIVCSPVCFLSDSRSRRGKTTPLPRSAQPCLSKLLLLGDRRWFKWNRNQTSPQNKTTKSPRAFRTRRPSDSCFVRRTVHVTVRVELWRRLKAVNMFFFSVWIPQDLNKIKASAGWLCSREKAAPDNNQFRANLKPSARGLKKEEEGKTKLKCCGWDTGTRISVLNKRD